ncbi:probable calcium-binding protein CML21 [Amborella trichopoda]|uniref:EF-hand domain-containing protein n=1 Tax=Amborella trichopoda TaxID=13333 RepID=W1P2K9_AMBTC|nr:probable calcium-binding protein CML21 [Amborella trichopoda]ERN01821.1 hypothetical protein AMTR_s00089p00059230 [Amborella trichopoda]|eukprot:XP_020520339.1 probable calcium-binding protein CML21 [Amborella trichopoda]
MGGIWGRLSSPLSQMRASSKLHMMVGEAMKRRVSAGGGSPFRSIDGMLMKFPKLIEGLKELHIIFDQFDKDSNGTINWEELRQIFSYLQLKFSDQTLANLYDACEMDGHKGINFAKLVLLLGWFHLLEDHPYESHAGDLPHIEGTFNTLIDAFVFLDKNGDGYINRKEMVQAIKEAPSKEKSSKDTKDIAMNRFKEMDCDKNGHISFKEFLLAFTRWIEINDDYQ